RSSTRKIGLRPCPPSGFSKGRTLWRFSKRAFRTISRAGVTQTATKEEIMKSIGIVGSGIAGLHLGLFLQKDGVDATIYSDKAPDQIRAGRLHNLVVRFDRTRERERALGVDHWEFPDFGVFGVHMRVGIAPPIVWNGSFKRPASSVDMHIYQS